MLRLHEIPGLEDLYRTADRLQVKLTARGGLVRRYMGIIARRNDVAATSMAPPEPDVFSLTPFIADIDIVHSGPSSLTPQVIRAIHDDVPMAECFRWEVRSRADDAVFVEAMRRNAIIPANLISLSTQDIDDPWDGRFDLAKSYFRLIRNGFYSESPLFRAGKDVEVFAVLLYARVLLEAEVAPADMANQPGMDAAQAISRDAREWPTMSRLQDSAYLRARLRYLLKAVAASAPSQGHLNAVLVTTALDEFIAMLDEVFPYPPVSIGEAERPRRAPTRFSDELSVGPGSVPMSSAHLIGDVFRLASHTEPWLEGSDAERQFSKFLEDSGASRVARAGENPEVDLGEGQRVLFASPFLEMHAGQSSNAGQSGPSETAAELTNEMFSFSVTPSSASNAPGLGSYQGYADQDFGVILGLEKRDHPTAIATPLASCVSASFSSPDAPSSRRYHFRVACGDLLEQWAEPLSSRVPPRLRLFVVGHA